MTKAEKFIEKINGTYKGIKVLAVLDTVNNFWSDFFDNKYYLVKIMPLNGNDDIGCGCGQFRWLKFKK
jgi:hypothetical protein